MESVSKVKVQMEPGQTQEKDSTAFDKKQMANRHLVNALK